MKRFEVHEDHMPLWTYWFTTDLPELHLKVWTTLVLKMNSEARTNIDCIDLSHLHHPVGNLWRRGQIRYGTDVTPGGLAEAHNYAVERVLDGSLPLERCGYEMGSASHHNRGSGE